MHDNKMSYQLSGHAAWTKLEFPFQKCKCNRDACVKVNNAQKCELATNEEQLHHYDMSKHFYKTLSTRTEMEIKKKKGNEMDW